MSDSLTLWPAPVAHATIGDTWDSDPRTYALHAELVSTKAFLHDSRLERESERDALRVALDAALTKEIGNERLIDVMRRRYGRECEQWKANHDERKRERDALRAEIDRLKAQPFVPSAEHARVRAQLKRALETVDAMAGEALSAQDKRQATAARQAMQHLAAVMRTLSKEAGGIEDERVRNAARAWLVEQGVRTPEQEVMVRAHEEWEGKR